jgi:thymidylate synthase
MFECESISEGLHGVLLRLMERGEHVDGVASPNSIGSKFAGAPRPFTETRGDGFRLLDPRRRWATDSARQANASFAVANFLFTLAGGHDMAMITAYNARGVQFAEDQSRYEAAFGARLFSPGHQLAYVLKKLRADPASRRATAIIYCPEDTLLDRRDTPCGIGLQFLIRQSRLECICFMRSQSAAMVMPYDIFLFTMIQEWLAVELGIDVGPYTHLCASLHYYDDESAMVDAMLAAPGVAAPMPAMMEASPHVATTLVEAERRLRFGALEWEAGLDRYWQKFLQPLADHHVQRSSQKYFLELAS